MNRVIETAIAREHYRAPACIVWCFDCRFSDDRPGTVNLLEKFKDLMELRGSDVIEIAGGAKDIVSPSNEADREYVLGEIEKSLKLHASPLLVLMVHADCGAYGTKFADEKEEGIFCEKELNKAEDVAKAFLAKRGLDVKIEKYYADFSGLFRI